MVWTVVSSMLSNKASPRCHGAWLLHLPIGWPSGLTLVQIGLSDSSSFGTMTSPKHWDIFRLENAFGKIGKHLHFEACFGCMNPFTDTPTCWNALDFFIFRSNKEEKARYWMISASQVGRISYLSKPPGNNDMFPTTKILELLQTSYSVRDCLKCSGIDGP